MTVAEDGQLLRGASAVPWNDERRRAPAPAGHAPDLRAAQAWGGAAPHWRDDADGGRLAARPRERLDVKLVVFCGYVFFIGVFVFVLVG